MNRRGSPDEIFSDCGTNFQRIVQELKIDEEKSKSFQQTKVPHGT